MEEELEFYSNGYRELSAEVNELRGAILLLKKNIIFKMKSLMDYY